MPNTRIKLSEKYDQKNVNAFFDQLINDVTAWQAKRAAKRTAVIEVIEDYKNGRDL